MGTLKIMFKNPPLPLYNVANPKHSLTQVWPISFQHCYKGEGGRNTKLYK